MTARYLPAEAFSLIGELFRKHPGWSLVGLATFYAAVAASMRWRFGRGAWVEVLVLSLFLTTVAFFVGACFYILKSHPGFRLA
jgi:hypothetical protein